MKASPQGTGRTVTQLVNCLGLGGTEVQLVASLRQLSPDKWRPEVFCLQKVGELLHDLGQLGIDPTEFHLRGSLLRPNTLAQMARMARRLRANGSVLLHSHDFYSNLLAPTTARLAGIPSLVSRRDLGAWIGPLRARALALATRQADHVLCNAWAVRDHLVNDEGIAPGRITVVPNGLDLGVFDRRASNVPRELLPALANGWNVAFVANMKHALKGHEEFLIAARHLLQQVPEARFVLLGDGALRPRLEERARALGIAARTLFLGRRTDVAAILSQCQVSVCASWTEGLSNAVMESMAARLPVVATAVGGNVELVRDGRTGFLVPKSDAHALAARLYELARQPALARRMGEAGRRRIETDFDAVRLGERIDALYSRVLGRRGEWQRAA